MHKFTNACSRYLLHSISRSLICKALSYGCKRWHFFNNWSSRPAPSAGLPDFSWCKSGKTYQITTKYVYQITPIGQKSIPTSSIARPSEIYPNWDFWCENMYACWQPCPAAFSSKKNFFFSDDIFLFCSQHVRSLIRSKLSSEETSKDALPMRRFCRAF
jgi:hypothetical protein